MSTSRPAFPSDPRADQHAAAGPGGDREADDRPSRAGVGKLGREVLAGIRTMFKTTKPVDHLPGLRHRRLGGGARQHALPRRRVLMFETGWFADAVEQDGDEARPEPEFIKGDWRSGVDAVAIEARLAEDKGRTIKAVCVVHNETSTGVASNIAAVRRAIDQAGHPALLLVDTISSLGSIDYRHEEWGVDVTVGGSQKGLMLPPGLSFNAISDKALAAARQARLPRSFGIGRRCSRSTTRAISPTRRRRT